MRMFAAAAVTAAVLASSPYMNVETRAAGPVALAPGDMAPLFTLKGSDGRTYRLADYRGKQAVVLAWFAKAFTGG
jgi:peroxiredoxin Q/BCP